LDPQHQEILFKRHFRASSLRNSPPKPIFQLEVIIFFTHNFTLQLFGYLNTKKNLSKSISEQLLFFMSLLNPFSNLKHPFFFTHNYTLQLFWISQHQEILFKRHFRASSFLNSPSKPIFQLEVSCLFTHNFTLQLFGYINTKKYLSKGISEQVPFLMSLLNPFYKLNHPSFSPTTLLYSFLDISTPSNTFQKAFQSKFLS
jgi:hypothetical protein